VKRRTKAGAKELPFQHGKNDFAEVSKNSARYVSKNNFVEPSK